MDPFERNFPTPEELEWFLEHRTVDQKSIQNGEQAEQDEILKDIKKAKSIISDLKIDSQIIACISLYDGVGFNLVYDSLEDSRLS
jgi:hypothetical protein